MKESVESSGARAGVARPLPINAPEYIAAWEALVERPLSFEEFSALPMPAGVTPTELWRHFSALRRVAGVTMGVKPWFRVDRDVSWAFVPKSTQLELNQLMSMAYPDSTLNAFVRQGSQGDYALLPFVLDEVYSLARRDGLRSLTKTALRALWLREREPESRAEKVVANAADLFCGIERYAKRQFTTALVEMIHEDLTAGVGEIEGLTQPWHFGADLVWKERVDNPEFVLAQVEAATADCRQANPFLNFLYASCELSYTLWDLRFFPSLNALTELIVRRAFFARHDMPVLSYVPFSRMSGYRVNDYAGRFMTEHEHLVREAGSGEGVDCTFEFSGAVTTYLKGLLRISDRVAAIQREDASSRERLEHMDDLNRRQKDLLLVVRRNPTMTIRLRHYAELNRVAYATARADLLNLVDRGYLACRKEGRAFVFSAAARAVE